MPLWIAVTARLAAVPFPSVCAVVLAPGSADRHASTLEALDAQTHALDRRVVLGDTPQTFHRAIAAAADSDATWLWLLDQGIVPQRDALEHLFAALPHLDGLPAAVLLASKVVGVDGELDPHSVPWPPLLDRVVTIGAAQRRLVMLRLARWGSLLVHRDVIVEHGLPRADFASGADALEWTSRVLRDGGGYLSPRSVVVRQVPPDRAVDANYGELRDRVRMVRRDDRWTAQEPVWWAFLVAVEAVRELRARPRPGTALRLARALGQGVADRA